MFFTFDFYILLPEVFFLSSSFILLIFGVLVSSSNRFGYPVLNLTIGKLERNSFKRFL